MIKGANVIIYNDENKVLLQLRDNKKSIPYPNTWVILGGGIEEGETPQQALKRELLEETGLKLPGMKLWKIYREPEGEEYVFLKKVNLDITKIDLKEGQKLAWFSEEEIKDLKLGFFVDLILEDFFGTI